MEAKPRELTPAARAAELERILGVVAYHDEQARQAARSVVLHKIAVGEALAAARALMTPGEFWRWAEYSTRYSRAHIERHLRLAANASRVMERVGPDASMRAALSALGGGATSETWLLVGKLEAKPGEAPDPAALVETVKAWRVRKG